MGPPMHPRETAPPVAELPPDTLVHSLDRAAAGVPERAALVFGDQVLSYAQLRACADALAGFLQQRCAVQPGERVLLLSQNCPAWWVAYHAVLRAGAVVVPASAVSTGENLRQQVADSGAVVACVAQELLPRLAACLGPGGLRHAVVHSHDAVLPGPKPRSPRPVPQAAPFRQALPAQGGAQLTAWHDAVAAGLDPAARRPQPDDLCLLPYAAGTTGRPRRCRHTHRSLLAAVAAAWRWRGLGSDAVVLAVAPLFHLRGLQSGLNLPVALGARVVMLQRWDPHAAAALIERHRVTTWAAAPAMLTDFLAAVEQRPVDLSSLRLLSGCCAPMPAGLATRLKERLGLDFHEAYSLAEGAGFLLGNPPGAGKPHSLGMAPPGVDARVVELRTLQACAPGTVGELLVHGPQLMQGYWNDPAADRQAFVEIDGRRFLRTGDLAHADEQGCFFLHDRLVREARH